MSGVCRPFAAQTAAAARRHSPAHPYAHQVHAHTRTNGRCMPTHARTTAFNVPAPPPSCSELPVHAHPAPGVWPRYPMYINPKPPNPGARHHPHDEPAWGLRQDPQGGRHGCARQRRQANHPAPRVRPRRRRQRPVHERGVEHADAQHHLRAGAPGARRRGVARPAARGLCVVVHAGRPYCIIRAGSKQLYGTAMKGPCARARGGWGVAPYRKPGVTSTHATP